MAIGDPLDDYRRAVDQLADLEKAVAAQQSQDQVLDAIIQLRLAVVRAYDGRRPRHAHGRGGRSLVLAYLQERIGEWVYGDELAAVSGIGEWARRVRELRVEEGYEIEEDGGRYRLLAHEPNLDRRTRWQVVPEVKELTVSPLERVQALLQRLVGRVVTVEELDRVARSRNGASLARELRESESFPVESSTDAPDLAPGEYRLVSNHSWHKLDEGQGLFTEELRARMFSRDRYRCWTCGLDRTAVSSNIDDPFYLMVRHLDSTGASLEQLPMRRLTDLTRLATSCNRCISGRTS